MNGTAPSTILIPELNHKAIALNIVGKTDILTDAIPSGLDLSSGPVKKIKKPKDITPEESWQDGLYILDGTDSDWRGRVTLENCPIEEPIFGFPASAFRASIIDCCRTVPGVTMAQAEQMFIIMGNLIPLEFSYMDCQPEKPRTDKGILVDKYFGRFHDWSLSLLVEFDADFIGEQMMVNLVNKAGTTVGVGKKRPKCKGSNGMFTIN